MGRKLDAAGRAVNTTMRLVVSALWGAGMVAAFAAGAWPIGLLCLAYLGYLWIFGGRWLIY